MRDPIKDLKEHVGGIPIFGNPKRPKRFFSMEDIEKHIKVSECRHKGKKKIIRLEYGYFIRSCSACGKDLELTRISLNDLQKKACREFMREDLDEFNRGEY